MSRAEFTNWAVDEAGNVVASAAFEVRWRSNASLVTTVYDAASGVGTVSNPGTATSGGLVNFWLPYGEYEVTIGSGASAVTIPFNAMPPYDVPRTFASRAAAVAELEAFAARGGTAADGTVISAAGRSYRASSGATDISDMPGWVPVWPYFTDHFPGIVAARNWSGTNQVLIHDVTTNSTGSFLRIGPNIPVSNAEWYDAAFSVMRAKSTTGANDHGIAATLDMSGVSGAGATGYAASFMAYNSCARDGYDIFAAGLRAGARIYNTDDGYVRAAIFEASFPLTNTGAAADGVLVGIEIAAKNFGGSDVSDVDNAALRKQNILFAQGGEDPATEHNPTTAMTVNGVDGPGWYYGHAMRNVHIDYINMSMPAASGARALNIRPDADWDDSVILIPEGSGIGAWDSGETTVTFALEMDETTAGAVNFPVGVRLAGGSLLSDYDEGSYTVQIQDSSGNTSATTTTGYYTRVGNKVTVWFTSLASIDVTGLTGTDNVRLIMPFNAATHSASAPINATGWASTTGSPSLLWADFSSGGNHAFIRGSAITGVLLTQRVQDISGGTINDFCITFEVA